MPRLVLNCMKLKVTLILRRLHGLSASESPTGASCTLCPASPLQTELQSRPEGVPGWPHMCAPLSSASSALACQHVPSQPACFVF